MAVELAVGNILCCRLLFSITGEIDVGMNVLHYRVKDLVGSPSAIADGLVEIATDVLGHFDSAWKVAASDGVQFDAVSVTNIYPLPRSVTVSAVPEDPVLGEIDSLPLPLQNSATILKKSNLGGRAGYGRMFYVGLPENSQIKGVITPAAMANLGEMRDVLADPINVTGTGWTAVLEPVLKQGPDDNPTLITPVAFARIASNVIRAQRRRQPGKGS